MNPQQSVGSKLSIFLVYAFLIICSTNIACLASELETGLQSILDSNIRFDNRLIAVGADQSHYVFQFESGFIFMDSHGKITRQFDLMGFKFAQLSRNGHYVISHTELPVPKEVEEQRRKQKWRSTGEPRPARLELIGADGETRWVKDIPDDGGLSVSDKGAVLQTAGIDSGSSAFYTPDGTTLPTKHGRYSVTEWSPSGQALFSVGPTSKWSPQRDLRVLCTATSGKDLVDTTIHRDAPTLISAFAVLDDCSSVLFLVSTGTHGSSIIQLDTAGKVARELDFPGTDQIERVAVSGNQHSLAIVRTGGRVTVLSRDKLTKEYEFRVDAPKLIYRLFMPFSKDWVVLLFVKNNLQFSQEYVNGRTVGQAEPVGEQYPCKWYGEGWAVDEQHHQLWLPTCEGVEQFVPD